MSEICYSYTNTGVFPIRYIARKNYSAKSKENLNRGFKTLGVSNATMKKIKTASRVLSYASKLRKVRNSKGQYINHLCMFITLTLPYQQTHTDSEITKKILGTFFDKCRKIGILENYVWRAEKQINGNIHYHILTDSFVNYSMIYRIWLVALERLNYISQYKKKFSSMSFSEYRSLNHNKNLELVKLSDRYARGVRNNWSQPPCVKTDYCDDVSQISSYIAKYTAKVSADDNIVTGRVWSCSTSVSDAVKSFKGDKEFNKFWYEVGFSMMRRKVIEFDYFSIVDFKFTSLIAWFSDMKKYVSDLFSKVFTPCNFYLKSLGLVPI